MDFYPPDVSANKDEASGGMADIAPNCSNSLTLIEGPERLSD